MNWSYNKILFNYIIKKDYLIKKDIESTNILFIKWDQFDIKCKYFLAFSIGEEDDIIWSCDNPYIDQKTRYLSLQLKNSLEHNNKYSSIFLNELKKIFKSNTSVIYDTDKINFIWCLKSVYKKYKQFYVITDLIYF